MRERPDRDRDDSPGGDARKSPDGGTTPSPRGKAHGNDATGAEAGARSDAPRGDAQGGAAGGDAATGADALAAALGGDIFASSAFARGTSGDDASGNDAFGGDEPALRRMLHSAVEDLAPSEGALDHLRKAVPARRARKRQALVGVAASVILLGTAVPAFVHVANSGALSDARPVNAGHGEQAQGGTGTETGDDGGDREDYSPSGEEPGTPGTSGESVQPDEPGSATASPSPGAPADIADSIPAATPTCEAAQLGVDGTELGAPDPEGKVYGTFRIANTSRTSCAVTGAGSVEFQAAGAADPAKISVVDHTAGDPATGLPAPALQSGAVLLEPATSYEVKFAFVPSDTCPTTGASPDPTPSDGGSSGTTDGTAAATDAEPQLVTEDGGTADGSISVSHTPEAGAPKAEATIPNACSGTIYRTGVLHAS
ncbi:hypothetical protein ACFU5O_22530 [Streptomyces sp. NPDC057445]|uniref:hypothetical protein n=1 Tax=Streptomyces sp. NPDC057445 TaxID=3346136 RepID=UPI0036963009